MSNLIDQIFTFYGYENNVLIIKPVLRWIHEAAFKNGRGEKAAACSSSKAGLLPSTGWGAEVCRRQGLQIQPRPLLSPKQAYAKIKLEKKQEL